MSDETDAIRDGLRGASDGLLEAIQEVDLRERRKRGVPPTDPGFQALARGVRDAAEAVLELSSRRRGRGEQDRGSSGRRRPPDDRCVASTQSLAGILEEWRAVERRLQAAEATSPEATRLMEEFEALRDRYAQALKTYRG